MRDDASEHGTDHRQDVHWHTTRVALRAYVEVGSAENFLVSSGHLVTQLPLAVTCTASNQPNAALPAALSQERAKPHATLPAPALPEDRMAITVAGPKQAKWRAHENRRPAADTSFAAACKAASSTDHILDD
jgi:hypothetical protein